MSKKNDDFFKEKKIWSEVKDELLGCYLFPYFTKILHTRTPILYIDCFAGQGKFDDGKNGSPLMALDSLNKSLAVCKNIIKPKIHMRFIELNHAEELKKNIPRQSIADCQVISGKFENNIIPLLQKALNKQQTMNVFLYVDPYGVKVLNAKLFDSLPSYFNTAELLINLNSFGFIREACRVKKVAFRESEDEIFSDIKEYDSSVFDSIRELNDIAGGNYWQAIIDAYSEGRIDCYKAEKEFSQRYKERLRRNYIYVLDMPIRLKTGQHPKYRMIYATNHQDGCTLMADNIAKRTDRLVIEVQNGGQLSLIPQTAENEMVSDDMLMQCVKALLDDNPIFIHLNKFLADFYNEYGVLCELARLSSGRKGSVLKTLEKIGYIDVQRTPAFTHGGKKHSTFWRESNGKTICLRKRS